MEKWISWQPTTRSLRTETSSPSRSFRPAGRDELTPESDVDVLVQFDAAATFDRYMDLKLYLEDFFGRSVDLVTANALKAALRSTVGRHAVYIS